MAKLDLTKLPATVTIKNVSVNKKIVNAILASDTSKIKHDEGTTAPGAIDMQTVDKEGNATLPASTEVQMFGINLFKELETQDEIVIHVETSKELLYWTQIGKKFPELISVDIVAAE